MAVALLSSTASNAEASQIIGTINGVIQDINENTLQLASSPTSFRNAIIGGDFTTNPWQRATSFAAIANTLTYTADRWCALGGASSSIAVSKYTTAAGLPIDFGAALQFQRTAANADTTAIELAQVLTANDTYQFQGQPCVFSFWAKAGANYSAASSVLGVTIATGTTADQGAAGLFAASWAGYAAATLTGSAGTTVTGVTLTTSWARYSVACVIPAAALELGVKFTMTPVGTAGADDWFQLAGVQLEVMPNGGVQPSPFERRQASIETVLCQRFYQQFNEPASLGVVAMGKAFSTTQAVINLPIFVPFRTAPTATFPAAAGGLVLTQAGGTISGTITGTINTTAGLSTANAVSFLATIGSAVLTAGHATTLQGTGGGSAIKLSAEL
jgi:hypothetical protein